MQSYTLNIISNDNQYDLGDLDMRHKCALGKNSFEMLLSTLPSKEISNVLDAKSYSICYKFVRSLETTIKINWQQICDNTNLMRLKSYIYNLPESINFEEYDMICPSKQILDNAYRIIEKCPNDKLLSSVNIFPRNNGTILIKWHDKKRMATINVGKDKATYSIISLESKEIIENLIYITNNDIDEFFTKL